jgi:hypothetical protein
MKRKIQKMILACVLCVLSFSALGQTPLITNYDPGAAAINVPLGKNFKLTFDQPIRWSTNIDGGTYVIRFRRFSDNVIFEEYTIDILDGMIDVKSPYINIVDGNSIFIEHVNEFVQNTQYYVTISAGIVENTNGEPCLAISKTSPNKWSFTTEKVRTWKGSAGSDWIDVDNWVGGLIFEDNSTLKIPDGVNKPIVETNIVTNDLIIGDKGGITISSAGSITINGKLELQSSIGDNADFVCLGGLSYDPEKVRIYQHIDYNARTYHVASPVIDATQTSIGCDLGMYQWDISIGDYSLYSASAVMDAAQGFALRSTQNLMFTGSIQTGDVIKSISRTGSNAGWNFVGNPYPCAIDMRHVARSAEVLESFWVYNSLATTYATINAVTGATANSTTGTKIPSNHAFWTQVKPTFSTGTLTFSNNSKAFADGTFLKAASIEPIYYNLKLACGNGTVNDEFLISFAAESSDGYDMYDSEKKFSTNAAIAQPFMTVEGKELVINSYPKLENELIVPVKLRVGAAGDYTFERISIENFEESVGLYLIDLQENQVVDLRNIQSYPFSVSSTGDLIGRFQVKFVGSIATQNKAELLDDKTDIVVFDKKISLKFATNGLVDVDLIMLDGKSAGQYKFYGGEGEISVKSAGIYVVKFVTSNGVYSQKVLVK